jgi:PAS domain S-box-containing protein
VSNRSEAQAHLAARVSSPDDAVISRDTQGQILSWNSAAEHLFGYSEAEALGQPIRLIIPAELLTEEDDVLRRIRAGETIDHYETIRVTKGGHRLGVSLTVSPLKSASGEVIGASQIMRDQTGIQRAQRDAFHLSAIVDSTDDAIVSKDLNSLVTSWNAAAERMFGFTAGEMLGRSIRLIIPADRQPEEDDVLDHIRRGERVDHFETVRQRKDGTLFPVSLTISPIRDQSGTIIGASKIARDLSDKARDWMTARQLAAVVESSDDAIISKNLESIITTWNPAAERMFGYTAAEAVGRSIRMLIPDELQDEEDVVLAKIRAGEKIDHFETVRQRKDGTRLSISLTVSPIRDETGRVVGASKIARDVTERTRLEAAAREHAANTAKLGEMGALVASTLDRAAIARKVTEVATALTHAQWGAYTYNEHDRDSGDEFMQYATAGAPREAVAQFLQWSAADVLESAFRGNALRLADVTADPRYEHRASPLKTADDLPARSLLALPVKGVSRDLLGVLFLGHSHPGIFSEQHERLAAGVAAWASIALENARLFDEAKEANRLKDEFLAVLSHELRTPLNAIVGYSRLLSGGVLSKQKAARGLEILERNATWLTQIVEDVLDVSRIVSGKIRLDVQPVDMSLIVENAVATVQPAADAKGIRVQSIVDPGVGPVSGDPGRLQQVIWNLLSNAVKFTGKAGRVQIRVERVNSHLEIIVSDTGAGIRPDFLPYVFERFRQADAGTTRKNGGLGLGLAIVRHIVEMHGGSVEASSAGEGQGATFTVRLPLMIVYPQRLDTPREHPRTERRKPIMELAGLSGIHVLAIDDEEDALTLMREILEAAGATVTTLATPIGAIERIEAVKPDVLVVDLGMPEIDGFELMTRIRRSPDAAVRDVPAAALTAFARAEDRTKALRSGFEMHLAKPVDPGELVASIATLARRARSQR